MKQENEKQNFNIQTTLSDKAASYIYNDILGNNNYSAVNNSIKNLNTINIEILADSIEAQSTEVMKDTKAGFEFLANTFAYGYSLLNPAQGKQSDVPKEVENRGIEIYKGLAKVILQYNVTIDNKTIESADHTNTKFAYEVMLGAMSDKFGEIAKEKEKLYKKDMDVLKEIQQKLENLISVKDTTEQEILNLIKEYKTLGQKYAMRIQAKDYIDNLHKNHNTAKQEAQQIQEDQNSIKQRQAEKEEVVTQITTEIKQCTQTTQIIISKNQELAQEINTFKKLEAQISNNSQKLQAAQEQQKQFELDMKSIEEQAKISQIKREEELKQLQAQKRQESKKEAAIKLFEKFAAIKAKKEVSDQKETFQALKQYTNEEQANEKKAIAFANKRAQEKALKSLDALKQNVIQEQSKKEALVKLAQKFKVKESQIVLKSLEALKQNTVEEKAKENLKLFLFHLNSVGSSKSNDVKSLDKEATSLYNGALKIIALNNLDQKYNEEVYAVYNKVSDVIASKKAPQKQGFFSKLKGLIVQREIKFKKEKQEEVDVKMATYNKAKNEVSKILQTSSDDEVQFKQNIQNISGSKQELSTTEIQNFKNKFSGDDKKIQPFDPSNFEQI